MYKYNAIKFPVVWLSYEVLCLFCFWMMRQYQWGIVSKILFYITYPFTFMINLWVEYIQKAGLTDMEFQIVPGYDSLILISFIYVMIFFCLGFIVDVIMRAVKAFK